MFIWTKEVMKRVITLTFKVDLELNWRYSGVILSVECFLLVDAESILFNDLKSLEDGCFVSPTHLRLLPNLPGQVQRSVKTGPRSRSLKQAAGREEQIQSSDPDISIPNRRLCFGNYKSGSCLEK